MLKKILLISVILLYNFTYINLYSYEIIREEIITKDKVTIVAKHYFNKNGTPIIMLHGFASNLHTWDYPMDGHNFAKFMAEKGFDVWVPSLRGHGEGEFQSGPSTSGKWDFDTFLAYDIPAIIEEVSKKTGEKPFWVGHSMGAMLMYAYLQGAYTQKIYTDHYSANITSSEELAKIRNNKLAGFISVAGPFGINYPVNLQGKGLQGLLNTPYSSYNLLLQYGTTVDWKYLKYPLLIGAYNETIVDTLKLPPKVWINDGMMEVIVDFLSVGYYDYLGISKENIKDMGYLKKTIFEKTGRNGWDLILGNIWNTKNVTKDMVFLMAKTGLDNISIRLLQQFFSWIRTKQFVEQCDSENCIPYNYSTGISRITLPTLIITGGLDKLANKDIIKEEIFNKIGSNDKKFIVFPNFGHVDLCMGIKVNKVFNTINNWVNIHNKRLYGNVSKRK